jgi:hypothetical protein
MDRSGLRVLDDDHHHPDPGMDPSPDRPATAPTRARVASMGVLALLMVGTSWVVASWVSAWLVPPYLILMALLLLPSAGRPQGDPAEDEADADPADALEPALPVEGPDDRSAPKASPAPAEASDGPDGAAASPPTRGRRGKGKARRTKPVAEPVEATWIEVAPGKFIRSEAARSTAEAGPHGPVGVPVEVPATPQPQDSGEVDPLDRAEAPEPEEAPPGADAAPEAEVSSEESRLDKEPPAVALPAFDGVEGREDGPIGGVIASGSTDAWESGEGSETSRIVEGLPAADGNAPQAEGSFDEPEADRPDADSEATDDRAWAGAVGEGSEPVDTPAPDDLAPSLPPILQGPTDRKEGPTARAETPEPRPFDEVAGPAGWAEGPGVETSEAVDESGRLEDSERPVEAALTDVAPESADESMVFDEGDDPTETAVDETVLDDAGPSEDALDASGISPAEDPPAAGSDWWPRRLSPRARTRDGHDARASSNVSPPRRPVRSRGPSHRPPDPRRLTRRGAGRPRQIIRTFPPRSPPRRGIGRRRF